MNASVIKRCSRKLLGTSACICVLFGCAPTPARDPAGQLEELGATLRRDAEGRVTALRFRVKSIVNDDALRHVASLRHLTSLDLDRTPITDAGLAHLKELTQLRELGLRGTRVTAAGLLHLSHLDGLEELQLASCGQVNDAAIPVIIQLESLRKLAIGGTRLTPAGIRELRGGMPDCEIY